MRARQSILANRRQIKRGVKATARKAMDTSDQVKHEAQVAANKVVDTGDQVKHALREIADKVVGAGDEVKRETQVVADKVASAGSQIKQKTKATVNKTVNIGKEKFLEIAALAEPNLGKFRQELTDASKKYTDVIADTIDLTNQKLGQSAELIDPEGRYRNDLKKAALAIGVATAGAYTEIVAASPSFAELPQALKTKMVFAGMGGEQGFRSIFSAESFYESSIPGAVKNIGSNAVVDFLDGKHASHITSVHNDPSLAMTDSNILWEAARDNLARGSSNMSGLELAEANISNLVDVVGIIGAEALEVAATAACVGMALEGIVSLGENLIYVYAKERTAEEAAIDIAKNMIKKGALAAVGGAVISIAIACGAGPALSSAAPIIVTIGGTIYVIGAISRIAKAYKETQPELATSMQ